MPSKDFVLRIDGARLVPVTHHDVADLHRLFLDSEVRRYLLDGLEMDREWVEQVVGESQQQFEVEGTGLWKVEVEDGEQGSALRGVIGLREFFEPPRMQLIFDLDPCVWGRGFAVRGSSELLRYLFEARGLTRVEAATDEPNLASVRVLERLGFRRFVPSSPGLTTGEFGETLFFDIDADAAAAARQRSE